MSHANSNTWLVSICSLDINPPFLLLYINYSWEIHKDNLFANPQRQVYAANLLKKNLNASVSEFFQC